MHLRILSHSLNGFSLIRECWAHVHPTEQTKCKALRIFAKKKKKKKKIEDFIT